MIVNPAVAEAWYYVDLVIESAKESAKNPAEPQYKQGFMGLKPPGFFAPPPLTSPSSGREIADELICFASNMISNSSLRKPISFRPAGMLTAALALVILCLWNHPARADFRLCNNTSSRVGIALGYKDAEGWTTEGWWNVSSRTCETLLKGALVARFYYIYALDYDRGGEWSGQAFMCSRDKEFTIKGTENCLARGFDRTGFFEVDTGDQRAWTVQLTEANEQPAQQRVPGIPGTVGPGGNVPGGNVPGLSNTPGTTPPGPSGALPPAVAPGSKK